MKITQGFFNSLKECVLVINYIIQNIVVILIQKIVWQKDLHEQIISQSLEQKRKRIQFKYLLLWLYLKDSSIISFQRLQGLKKSRNLWSWSSCICMFDNIKRIRLFWRDILDNK
ncbi:unnamed protein product [Paramecium sonneborni]|uniref:Uncharacterized protein n=1 Tax=Paramecium sonneborni TaxID=65129 RepID=A0A8S1RU90_9CILI|nr:unnamed protein product [Paramecium sonneborni]